MCFSFKKKVNFPVPSFYVYAHFSFCSGFYDSGFGFWLVWFVVRGLLLCSFYVVWRVFGLCYSYVRFGLVKEDEC